MRVTPVAGGGLLFPHGEQPLSPWHEGSLVPSHGWQEWPGPTSLRAARWEGPTAPCRKPPCQPPLLTRQVTSGVKHVVRLIETARERSLVDDALILLGELAGDAPAAEALVSCDGVTLLLELARTVHLRTEFGGAVSAGSAAHAGTALAGAQTALLAAADGASGGAFRYWRLEGEATAVCLAEMRQKLEAELRLLTGEHPHDADVPLAHLPPNDGHRAWPPTVDVPPRMHGARRARLASRTASARGVPPHRSLIDASSARLSSSATTVMLPSLAARCSLRHGGAA